MRRIKEDDNIMGKVMAKTDNYDGLFKTELAKYDKARESVATNVSSQADILSRLRATHARFTQMYDVDAWRAATDARTRPRCARQLRTIGSYLPGWSRV